MQSHKTNQDKLYDVSKKSDLIKIMTSVKLYRRGRLDSHAFYHVVWFAICITYKLQSPIVTPNNACMYILWNILLTNFFACFILTYILDCEFTMEVVMVRFFPVQLGTSWPMMQDITLTAAENGVFPSKKLTLTSAPVNF